MFSQSINQSIKTLIQVDKPQRGSKIITLAKNEIKIRSKMSNNEHTYDGKSINVFKNHSGYKVSL